GSTSLPGYLRGGLFAGQHPPTFFSCAVVTSSEVSQPAGPRPRGGAAAAPDAPPTTAPGPQACPGPLPPPPPPPPHPPPPPPPHQGAAVSHPSPGWRAGARWWGAMAINRPFQGGPPGIRFQPSGKPLAACPGLAGRAHGPPQRAEVHPVAVLADGHLGQVDWN